MSVSWQTADSREAEKVWVKTHYIHRNAYATPLLTRNPLRRFPEKLGQGSIPAVWIARFGPVQGDGHEETPRDALELGRRGCEELGERAVVHAHGRQAVKLVEEGVEEAQGEGLLVHVAVQLRHDDT